MISDGPNGPQAVMIHGVPVKTYNARTKSRYCTIIDSVLTVLFTNVVLSLEIFNSQYLTYYCTDFDQIKTRKSSIKISFQ